MIAVVSSVAWIVIFAAVLWVSQHLIGAAAIRAQGYYAALLSIPSISDAWITEGDLPHVWVRVELDPRGRIFELMCGEGWEPMSTDKAGGAFLTGTFRRPFTGDEQGEGGGYVR